MKLCLLWTFFIGCQAASYWNLEDNTFRIFPDFPPADTKVSTGPNGVGKVLEYGPNAKPVVAEGKDPAYMINALTSSSDFSYYTWFKLPRAPIRNEVWTFFALQSKKKGMPVYFSIGVTARSTQGQGNEDAGPQEGDLKQFVFVKQFTNFDRNTKLNTLKLNKEFEPNKWYQLLIRIRSNPNPARRKRRATNKPIATVRVNCQTVGK